MELIASTSYAALVMLIGCIDAMSPHLGRPSASLGAVSLSQSARRTRQAIHNSMRRRRTGLSKKTISNPHHPELLPGN
jgi:hypothetical protein